ncbi:unnamed protein product, partial [Anisakis simplex]|uniref:Transforming growth factor, beta receptor III n=1 Tax=Anisakis simplex TaxID=6269 RepID=A0A0M3JMJ7_ANISI
KCSLADCINPYVRTTAHIDDAEIGWRAVISELFGVHEHNSISTTMVALFILALSVAVSVVLIVLLAFYCLMQCWRQRSRSATDKCLPKYCGKSSSQVNYPLRQL